MLAPHGESREEPGSSLFSWGDQGPLAGMEPSSSGMRGKSTNHFTVIVQIQSKSEAPCGLSTVIASSSESADNFGSSYINL